MAMRAALLLAASVAIACEPENGTERCAVQPASGEVIATATGAATSSAVSRPTSLEAPAASPTASQTTNAVMVVEVMDGNTLDVRVEGACGSPWWTRGGAECFGAEVSAFARGLLPPGSEVELERDVSERDRFGHLLLRLPHRRPMAKELPVEGGYAQVATFPPDVRHFDPLLLARPMPGQRGAALVSVCVSTAGRQRGLPRYPPDLDCGDVPHRRFQVAGASSRPRPRRHRQRELGVLLRSSVQGRAWRRVWWLRSPDRFVGEAAAHQNAVRQPRWRPCPSACMAGGRPRPASRGSSKVTGGAGSLLSSRKRELGRRAATSSRAA